MKNFFTLETNQTILKAQAFFGLIVGFLITFMPVKILQFFGVEIPHVVEFWQLSGMVVGVLGIGYYIASYDPSKYWPIVFIGFLSHLMASFVFIKSLLTGSLPFNFTIILLVSSLIWLIPLYCILNAVYEENIDEESAPKKFNDLIRFVRTSQNKTLLDLSQSSNILLVFVRHFGCTFCRENVSEMAKIESAINGKNMKVVFVHMSDPSYGDEFFSRYYDHPVDHISDPGRALYKSLNLKRGTLYQLFGPMTWIKGLYAGIFKGHGLGEFEGDGLQLGGVFILSKGQIIFEQKANSASHMFEINTLPEM